MLHKLNPRDKQTPHTGKIENDTNKQPRASRHHQALNPPQPLVSPVALEGTVSGHGRNGNYQLLSALIVARVCTSNRLQAASPISLSLVF